MLDEKYYEIPYLKYNAKKSAVMIYRSMTLKGCTIPNFKLNGIILHVVASYKYLGHYITDDNDIIYNIYCAVIGTRRRKIILFKRYKNTQNPRWRHVYVEIQDGRYFCKIVYVFTDPQMYISFESITNLQRFDFLKIFVIPGGNAPP